MFGMALCNCVAFAFTRSPVIIKHLDRVYLYKCKKASIEFGGEGKKTY